MHQSFETGPMGHGIVGTQAHRWIVESGLAEVSGECRR